MARMDMRSTITVTITTLRMRLDTTHSRFPRTSTITITHQLHRPQQPRRLFRIRTRPIILTTIIRTPLPLMQHRQSLSIHRSRFQLNRR